ncbi:MAG: NTP transferase domain-containing protein [Deltaproteobacteria bacterium]|nr:NTP transferase domain-containing protein [Deltaproteobacteria bacterium]
MRSAAILAGGAGRRMGKPKVFLESGGKYFFEIIAKSLEKAAGEVLIVTSHDISLPRVPPNVSVVTDLISGVGPLGGIYTALTHASGESVFICGVDMPLLSSDFVEYLFDVFESDSQTDLDLVIPRAGGRTHPLCAVYRKEAAGAVGRLIGSGERKAVSVVGSLKAKIVPEAEIESEPGYKDSLENINTPGELKIFSHRTD